MRTRSLKILRWIGSRLIPLFPPATLNVSLSISFLISLKLVKRRLGACRNSPYSTIGWAEEEASDWVEAGTWWGALSEMAEEDRLPSKP